MDSLDNRSVGRKTEEVDSADAMSAADRRTYRGSGPVLIRKARDIRFQPPEAALQPVANGCTMNMASSP